MRPLEQQIAERYPQWFRGRRAWVARPLLKTLGRWSGLDAAYGFLETHAHLRDFEFLEAAMDFLNLRYAVDHVERERIPESGAVADRGQPSDPVRWTRWPCSAPGGQHPP
jgi:hypothetical protein